MKPCYFLILLGLILSSCKSSGPAVQGTDKPVFTMSKTSCRGKCPVYDLVIYSNGLAKLNGKQNLDKIGNFKRTLDKKEFNNLTESFTNNKFTELKDQYDAPVTDLPTTITTSEWEGKYKKVIDYSGAPEILKNLERMLENVMKAEGWEKVE